MGRQKLEFDSRSFGFRKARRSFSRLVRSCLAFAFSSLAFAVLVYAIMSLLVSTDKEKMLQAENRMYADLVPSLEEKRELLNDGIAHLQIKDNSIYADIFHSAAPSPDPMGSLDFLFGSDTIPDTKILRYTDAKASKLVDQAAQVDAALDSIMIFLARPDKVVPPMKMPLENVVYPRIGASAGMKISPVLKTSVQHQGLDVLAQQGEAVLAPAAGTVSLVLRSRKGHGNMVELTHEGGYVTSFAHLSDISVTKGQRVSRGQRIGSVGMSGSAFAPHLHYEVRRDSLQLNPIGYIFESVGPEDYANIVYMSVRTEQSMD